MAQIAAPERVKRPEKKLDERGTVPTSVRLTPTCYHLWAALADEMGLSKTGVFETAIRRLAKEERVEVRQGQTDASK